MMTAPNIHMQKKTKAAVIGERKNVSLYTSAGVTVYDASDKTETLHGINTLVASGYGIIFISEDLFRECGDALAKYLETPYPIIIPVPCEGSDGSYAKQRIADNIKKAIGSEI